MERREIWFRNIVRWAPFFFIPIHWKGWLLLVVGPFSLIAAIRFLETRDPGVSTVLFVVGWVTFLFLICSHTEWPWDRDYSGAEEQE